MAEYKINYVTENGVNESISLKPGDCVYIKEFGEFIAVFEGVHEDGDDAYIRAYAVSDINAEEVWEDSDVCCVEGLDEIRIADEEEEEILMNALYDSRKPQRLRRIEEIIGRKLGKNK